MSRQDCVRILFICSRNQWRSPTAEEIYRRRSDLQVRSRGTSRKSRRQVVTDDIRWADLICVMEPKHLQRLRADFPDAMRHKVAHVLDIPDDYRYMDPELVHAIESSVEPWLADLLARSGVDLGTQKRRDSNAT